MSVYKNLNSIKCRILNLLLSVKGRYRYCLKPRSIAKKLFLEDTRKLARYLQYLAETGYIRKDNKKYCADEMTYKLYKHECV